MSLHIDTPLLESSAIPRRPGQALWLKMDALQPSGSFKLRGIGHACEAHAARGARRIVASSGGIVAGSLDRQPAERSPASPGPAGDAPLSRPGMIIVGSERDTLAVLLGRRPVVPLRTTGDAEALRLFKAHCPGP